MAKKKANKDVSKVAAKSAKKAKAAQKIERKEKKKVVKSKDEEEDDQDLEGILDRVCFCCYLRLLYPSTGDINLSVWIFGLMYGISRFKENGKKRIE